MRGEVPDDQAQAMIDVAGLGLVWGNNGYLTHVSKPTTLDLGEDSPGRAFNIMPAGLNKGRGIERFCELCGIDRSETLAIGDSESDFLAAPYVGTFVCVENARQRTRLARAHRGERQRLHHARQSRRGLDRDGERPAGG